MNIEKTIDGTAVTLRPDGWLDTVNAPLLGEAVEAVESAGALILDFSRVEYMSSAGLRQVVAAHKKAKALDAEFSVIHVGTEVMNIFRITGIDKKLRISAD